MASRVRDVVPHGKLPPPATGRFGAGNPLAVIHEVLVEHEALVVRVRRLTMEVVVVLWLIALQLYADASLGYVFERMAHSLRLVWPEEACPRYWP